MILFRKYDPALNGLNDEISSLIRKGRKQLHCVVLVDGVSYSLDLSEEYPIARSRRLTWSEWFFGPRKVKAIHD